MGNEEACLLQRRIGGRRRRRARPRFRRGRDRRRTFTRHKEERKKGGRSCGGEEEAHGLWEGGGGRSFPCVGTYAASSAPPISVPQYISTATSIQPSLPRPPRRRRRHRCRHHNHYYEIAASPPPKLRSKPLRPSSIPSPPPSHIFASHWPLLIPKGTNGENIKQGP